MSYHRLLERRIVEGRLREPGALIDYKGPPAHYFEPLDVREHSAWLTATRIRETYNGEQRAAA